MNPRLVVEAGDQAGMEFEVPPVEDAGEVVLGRSSGCQIRLDDSQLSRRHCKFSFRDDRLFVEDMESKNGTRVNGHYVKGSVELREGNRVEVGTLLLVVRYPVMEEPAQGEAPAAKEAPRKSEADEMTQEAVISPGRVFGGYRLEGVVRQGRFTTVFRACDVAENRPVALKLLRTEVPLSDKQRRRYQRGWTAAAELKHPNLISVLRVGEEGGVPFQAMEYVEGQDLQQLCQSKRAPMALPEALAVTQQVLEALQHVYERGLVMRSVRPENVLITGDGAAMVGDYDLLRPLPAEGVEEITSVMEFGLFEDARMSAPELVARPVVADQRCDIFGAGACLYFMLTLQAPFPELAADWHPPRAFSRQVRDPKELNASIPEPVSEIILKALSDYLDRRYRTPREMLTALQKVRGS